MQLPTVDYKADDAAAQFVESLRNTGFGVLKNHPIPQSLVESIYKNWQDFFNSEQKHEFLFSKETQDGYFPPSVSEVAKGHTVKDIKEYFHVYPKGRVPAQLEADVGRLYLSAVEKVCFCV